jgi:hypothetical protein
MEKFMNLYKFQTVNDYSISALSDLSLYFARSEQMNDPTENMFRLLEPNEYDKYAPDLSAFEKMGILSMAFGEPSQIEESPFMWAHYGNELKGFCLVFDFDTFKTGLRDSLTKSGPVKYKKHPYLLAGENLLNEHSGLEEVAGVDFKQDNLKRAYEVCFFDKPADFAQEREYRFLSQSFGLMYYHPNSLVNVIIGDRMGVKDQERLFETLDRLEIRNRLKVAKTKINSFKIHITEVAPNL